VQFKTIALFLCFISTYISLNGFLVSAEERRAQRKYKIDELMELAIEKNPSVYSALSDIDIAKGELRAAKAYPNPDLEFSLAKGKSREDNSSEAEFGISVIQPIEWPLKRLYRRKAGEEEVKISQFEKEAVKAELIFTTKQLYYSILLAKKDVDIARQNLDTSKTLLSIIERRVELGESRELDFIKSRIETLKSERELIRAETNLSTVKAILKRFIGNSLKKDFDLEGEIGPPAVIFSLEEIAQKTADFNPQLKAQKAEVKRTAFSLLEQKHLIVPDIFLQGFYEKELDKTALGGGIGISIPFWYQNQGGIQSARAEERKADFDLKLLEIEIGNSLEEEYKNYRVAFEQSKIFSEELLDRAKRSLEITQFSYEQGEIGLLDVLDTLRTYRDTLNEYYQILYEFYISKITLEKISGGKR
jgi:cobalt-zinc-cadmium efflux system outer membrane protein